MHGLEILQCDYKSASQSSMWSHKKRTHEGKIYGCDQCDFTTSEYYLLRCHVKRMHHVITPFKCDECEYTTSLKVSLTRHRREKHDTVQMKCDLCTFSGNQFAVGDHIRNRHSDAKKCKYCEYRTRKKSMMLNHQVVKHEGTYFDCDEFGSKLTTKQGLHGTKTARTGE